MPNWRPVDNRNLQGTQDAPADLSDSILAGSLWSPRPHCALLGRFGIGKFAQNDAMHTLEFPGLPEMQQHAVELVGSYSAVLQQENRPARVQLPRRSKSRFDER